MIHVYSLLSHDCRLLSLQVAALRQYLQPDSFSVVCGPYGSNPATSAGHVRLTDAGADRLGVRKLEAPEELAGLPLMQRLTRLFTLANDDFQNRQHEDWCLILHGDLFPVRSMTPDELADGKLVAGRIHPDSPYLAFTWLLVKRGATLPPLSAGVVIEDLKGWGAVREQTELGFEVCEPGWLHTDKLATASIGGMFGERFNKKVDVLKNRLGLNVADVDCCERVQGLVNHSPRFDVRQKPKSGAVTAKAKAMAKAGGCDCSRGKKTVDLK